MRNGDRFPKTAFQLDWAHGVLTCPQEVQMPFAPGGTVHFPAAVCAACPVQARRTASPRGRSVHIHPDERLLAEFRQRQLTAAGRAQLRERAAVKHSLAHIGHWQGWRARYRGRPKNLVDLRCQGQDRQNERCGAGCWGTVGLRLAWKSPLALLRGPVCPRAYSFQRCTGCPASASKRSADRPQSA